MVLVAVGEMSTFSPFVVEIGVVSLLLGVPLFLVQRVHLLEAWGSGKVAIRRGRVAVHVLTPFAAMVLFVEMVLVMPLVAFVAMSALLVRSHWVNTDGGLWNDQYMWFLRCR